MTFGVVCTWWRCKSSTLRNRSIGLLTCYAVSVLVGGLCHHFLSSFEAISSNRFRLLWTVCVGSVAIAGGFMGSYGSHLARSTHGTPVSLPEWFWESFGITMLLVTCAGGFSCVQPACDIFLAGITQTIPTVYIVFVVFTRTESYLTISMAVTTAVGFFLNSILLPFYSVAFYLGLQLSTINTMLHSCLTVAWGCQFICLCWICETVDKSEKTVKKL